MADVQEVESSAFPFSRVGMVLGAVLAGIGLFLVGAPIVPPFVRILGLLLFLIGIVVFIF